jgi:ligand-binding sensor domain-containing protein
VRPAHVFSHCVSMNRSSRQYRFWLFRAGRRQRFLVWLGLSGLALVAVLLGLAAVANARVPVLGWRPVSTLPDKPSPVQTLVWDPVTASLYASTAGGVFCTRDGGESWQSVGAGLTDRVEALAVDEGSGTVYAGTWAGVFRLAVGDERWFRDGDALKDQEVVALTVDTAGKRVYAATANSDVWGTPLDTAAWGRVGQLTSAPRRLLSSPGGELFAATDQGVFHWRNVAEGWRLIDAPQSSSGVSSALAVDEQRQMLYADAPDGGWRYALGKGPWMWAGLPAGAAAKVLALNAQTGELYAGSDSGVSRSSDEAATWQVSPGSPDHVNALAVAGPSGLVFAATDTGVYRLTAGGAQWEFVSAGLADPPPIYSLASDAVQGMLYVGTPDSGLFRSADDGAHWETVRLSESLDPGDDQVAYWAVDTGRGLVYASTQAEILRSSNKGLSWQGMGLAYAAPLAVDEARGVLYQGWLGKVFWSAEPPATGQAGDTAGSAASAAWQTGQAGLPADVSFWWMVVDQHRGAVYAGTSKGVYGSVDGGVTWASLGQADTPTASLALDAASGWLYAGAYSGVVYASGDGGQTWQGLATGLPTSAQALAVAANTHALYAGTGQGVFRYSNVDEKWLGAGLTGKNIRVLVAGGRGQLYAGTEQGLYRSDDEGQAWESINQGLSDQSILALAGDLGHNGLYAGTREGAFRLAGGGRWEKLAPEAEVVPISLLSPGVGENEVLGSGIGQAYRFGQLYQISPRAMSPIGGSFGSPIWGLAVDQRHRTLYVAASLELDRSVDGGRTWHLVRYLPKPGHALALDERRDVLYATDFLDTFSSIDGGQTWQNRPGTSIGVPPDYLWAWDQRGAVGRGLNGSLLWTAEGMHALWEFPATFMTPQPCVWADLRSGLRVVWQCGQGATVLQSELETMPLPWLALRLWVWALSRWLMVHALLSAAGVIVVLLGAWGWALLRTYQTGSRPFGVPLRVAVLTPWRQADHVQPAALEAAWPAWEQAVRAEVVRYGEARPEDLVAIPAPFRCYALKRYAVLNAGYERLAVRPGRVRLSDGEHIGRWHAAEGMTDKQARLFAETLGTTLGEAHDQGWARLYLTEVLDLPGQVVASARLVWLTEAWVGTHTVAGLQELLQKEGETWTLIVVASADGEADVLQQALARLAPAGHFLVLNQDTVAKLLLARDPLRRLAGWLGVPPISKSPDRSLMGTPGE